ncbi:hypothetical protein TIFTF001_022996 [Ficus carica]|uniref:Uncharacterized protein n=1 Tax=Ficus carica TaxID=3494 RepID=A0AA88DC55_FICCA|nr:hypothetical protein TIFTF001_022996 [Ficus carica]
MIDRQNKDKFFEEDISHDLSSLESLQPHESLHDHAKEISSNVPRRSRFAHKPDSSSTQKKESASTKQTRSQKPEPKEWIPRLRKSDGFPILCNESLDDTQKAADKAVYSINGVITDMQMKPRVYKGKINYYIGLLDRAKILCLSSVVDLPAFLTVSILCSEANVKDSIKIKACKGFELGFMQALRPPNDRLFSCPEDYFKFCKNQIPFDINIKFFNPSVKDAFEGDLIISPRQLQVVSLSLHPLFHKFFSHIMICPDQLNANGWRILAGFILFGAKSKIDIRVSDIFHFFSLTPRVEKVVINKSEKKKDVDGEKKSIGEEKKNGG